MVLAPVDVDEVDHVAEAQPVDQVADGAAQDEGQREARQPRLGGQPQA